MRSTREKGLCSLPARMISMVTAQGAPGTSVFGDK
jgi:hypothetical protein